MWRFWRLCSLKSLWFIIVLYCLSFSHNGKFQWEIFSLTSSFRNKVLKTIKIKHLMFSGVKWKTFKYQVRKAIFVYFDVVTCSSSTLCYTLSLRTKYNVLIFELICRQIMHRLMELVQSKSNCMHLLLTGGNPQSLFLYKCYSSWD